MNDASKMGSSTKCAFRSRLEQSVRVLVPELNPVLSGWGSGQGNYFRRGNSTRKFPSPHQSVRQRLTKAGGAGLTGLTVDTEAVRLEGVLSGGSARAIWETC